MFVKHLQEYLDNVPVHSETAIQDFQFTIDEKSILLLDIKVKLQQMQIQRDMSKKSWKGGTQKENTSVWKEISSELSSFSNSFIF